MKSILSIILFLACNNASGQTWLRTYCDTGGFGGSFAVETYDKGFLIGGSSSSVKENSILYKTDVNGNILWQRIIGISGGNTKIQAVCTTNDGGCAIVGYITKPNFSNRAFLLKLNACGQKDWAKIYDANASVKSTCVYLLADGGFVFNLEENINETTNVGWIYRSDKNGNKVWVSSMNYEPINISLGDSGNIIVTEHDYYEFYHDQNTKIPYNSVKFVKLDSTGRSSINGNITDFQTLGIQTLPAPGTGYLTCGSDASRNITDVYDLHLFIWNYNGLLINNITVQDSSNTNSPRDMIRSIDSDYYVLATHFPQNANGYNIKIIRIHNNTNNVTDPVYDYGMSLYPSTIRHTSDDKFIISGSIMNGNDSIGMYIVKLNTNLTPDSFYSSKLNYDYLCANIQDTGTIRLDNSSEKNLAVDEAINSILGFSVYPNPSHDYLNIQSSDLENDKVQITIFNTLGNKVLSEYLNPDAEGQINDNINLNHFANGIYFAELRQGVRYGRIKFIVY